MPLETTNSDPTLTEVISGILSDFQKLLVQQIALLKAELRADWDKTKGALLPLIAGGGLVAVGFILFGLTIALGIHWAVSPAGTDPGQIPLWGCFGIVAIAFVGIGMALVGIGAMKFQSFNPLPDETVDALTNNLKAIANSRGNTAGV